MCWQKRERSSMQIRLTRRKVFLLLKAKVSHECRQATQIRLKNLISIIIIFVSFTWAVSEIRYFIRRLCFQFVTRENAEDVWEFKTISGKTITISCDTDVVNIGYWHHTIALMIFVHSFIDANYYSLCTPIVSILSRQRCPGYHA